jgi:hypothetical protein
MSRVLAVSDWILGAATLAVGALLTTVTSLVVESIRRGWSRSDAASARLVETQRRADEQSEAAAREFVMDISEIRGLYRKHPFKYTREGWKGGGPWMLYAGPIEEKILSRAVDIRDAEVRARLALVVEALQNIEFLPEAYGNSPRQVVWKSTDIALNAIGAMLRGEALPEDAGVLEQYRQALFDAFGEPEDAD